MGMLHYPVTFAILLWDEYCFKYPSIFNENLLSIIHSSVQIAVAIKFSGAHGMILEMDNSKYRSRDLNGMDCSWISRYPEEDERYEICMYNISLLYILLYYFI